MVLFQQTTRSRGSRRFKAYRITEFEPVGELLDRFDTYLRRNRFPQAVERPYWLDGEGPVFEGTLAEFGDQFQPFAAFHTFVVTARAVHPFVVVPAAVDVVPVLAEGIEVAVSDHEDAVGNPVEVIDENAYRRPLSGVAGADGLLEWWHLFGLRAGRELARRAGDEERPTTRTTYGDRVVEVRLTNRRAFRRLSSAGVFVNYGADALGVDTDGADDADGATGTRSVDDPKRAEDRSWSADPSARLTRILRETATARYEYARHLWAVRGGEAGPRYADDPEAYAEERDAAAAHFLYDLIEAYDTALAPFSTGAYGAVLREETATRADTFDLSGRLDFDRADAASRVADVDPSYDPEYDHARR